MIIDHILDISIKQDITLVKAILTFLFYFIILYFTPIINKYSELYFIVLYFTTIIIKYSEFFLFDCTVFYYSFYAKFLPF